MVPYHNEDLDRRRRKRSVTMTILLRSTRSAVIIRLLTAQSCPPILDHQSIKADMLMPQIQMSRRAQFDSEQTAFLHPCKSSILVFVHPFMTEIRSGSKFLQSATISNLVRAASIDGNNDN
jgi:hypothetical protein